MNILTDSFEDSNKVAKERNVKKGNNKNYITEPSFGNSIINIKSN